jgi:hypothetical protein
MKHPQFLTDILNHPDISPADKETAKAEVERMMTDRDYAKTAEAGNFFRERANPLIAFRWSSTRAGISFWFRMQAIAFQEI